MAMSKFFSLISPLVTMALAVITFVFVVFFSPFWVLWLLVVVALGVINYLGILHVLGYTGSAARPWHHWFNVCEFVLLVFLLIFIRYWIKL